MVGQVEEARIFESVRNCCAGLSFGMISQKAREVDDLGDKSLVFSFIIDGCALGTRTGITRSSCSTPFRTLAMINRYGEQVVYTLKVFE